MTKPDTLAMCLIRLGATWVGRADRAEKRMEHAAGNLLVGRRQRVPQPRRSGGPGVLRYGDPCMARCLAARAVSFAYPMISLNYTGDAPPLAWRGLISLRHLDYASSCFSRRDARTPAPDPK